MTGGPGTTVSQAGRERRAAILRPPADSAKEWYSAAELADLRLPGMSETKIWITERADAELWSSREENGVTVYHASCLPSEARKALFNVKFRAKQVILDHLDLFSIYNGSGILSCLELFTRLYEKKELPYLSEWIYDAVPRLSIRSLRRWVSTSEIPRLGHARNRSRRGPDKGCGILNLAEGGAVAAFIDQLLTEEPSIKAPALRNACLEKFGNTVRCGGALKPMPCPRTFVRHIADFWENFYASQDHDGGAP